MPTGAILTQLLPAIGVADVLIGNPFLADGMDAIGITEGDIASTLGFTENALTAPEWTGDVPHQVSTMVNDVRVTVPLIVGDDSVYAKIHPTGTKSGGQIGQMPVAETSVLIIPKTEMGGGLTNTTGATAGWVRAAGQNVGAASGSAAAPIHALWLWRAYPLPGDRTFRFADGGKMIISVTFRAMLYITNPSGQQVYTIGDPAAQGVTTIRL